MEVKINREIREYTEYMSDIITAVKGQAVVMANEEDINFSNSISYGNKRDCTCNSTEELCGRRFQNKI